MAEMEYVGENIDLLLGREFLTWLWFRCDTGGVFRMKTDNGEEAFVVSMEQRMSVRGGEGENRETATVSGSLSPLREARLGLLTGKMVVSALVRMEKDGMGWLVTLRAEDLGTNSLKTPAVSKEDVEDDPDGLFLEKIYLIEQGIGMLDAMYREFLNLRLNENSWNGEALKVAEWMHHNPEQGTVSVE